MQLSYSDKLEELLDRSMDPPFHVEKSAALNSFFKEKAFSLFMFSPFSYH